MQAGVLPLIQRVAIALELRHIALANQIPIEPRLERTARHAHLHEVPHARTPRIRSAPREVLLLVPHLLAHIVHPRGEDAIERPGVLVGLELVLPFGVVLVPAVIEELNLAHRFVGGVFPGLALRDPEPQPVVPIRGHTILKAQHEVPEGLRGNEVPAVRPLAVREALQHARLLRQDAIHLRLPLPTGQVLPIKERDEPLLHARRVRHRSAPINNVPREHTCPNANCRCQPKSNQPLVCHKPFSPNRGARSSASPALRLKIPQSQPPSPPLHFFLLRGVLLYAPAPSLAPISPN